MSKHTPGPWHVDGPMVRSENIGICVVGNWTSGPASAFEGQDKANASLIAASPDMLEALKNAEKTIREYAKEVEGEGYSSDTIFLQADEIKDLIAKAEVRT